MKRSKAKKEWNEEENKKRREFPKDRVYGQPPIVVEGSDSCILTFESSYKKTEESMWTINHFST